jgi:aminopeptidase
MKLETKMFYIDWTDDVVTQIKHELAPIDSLKEFPLWKTKGFEEMAENGAAFISIRGTNPELLTGINPDRIALTTKSEGMAFKKLQSYVMANQISWLVIAVPSFGWARKVFPGYNDKQKQIEALWNAIFRATRVDLDNPIGAWQIHNVNLGKKLEYLNAKKYRYLHYAAPGTKLSIELPPNHIWRGGSSINNKGISFNANISTEEIFTVSLKEGVNGIVQSTRPLSYGGNLMEDFTLTFRNGRIVHSTAKTGYEVLKKLIKTDEGSHYLGEVALVPHFLLSDKQI